MRPAYELTFRSPDGSYSIDGDGSSLLALIARLLVCVTKHRWSHLRHGDGWRD